jgi:hypothetical protein
MMVQLSSQLNDRSTDTSIRKYKAMNLLFGGGVVLLIPLVGCKRSQPEKTQTFQRFVPVAGMPQSAGADEWSGAFALDTVTGQLCFAYESYSSPKSTIPLCRDLYEKTIK